MTEKRKFEISLLVMGDALRSSGYQPHSEETRRMSLRDARLLGETKPQIGDLFEFINNLLCEDQERFSIGSELGVENPHVTIFRKDKGTLFFGSVDTKLAYQWLLLMWGGKQLPINNTLRREIGNIAKRLGISEVQIVEFFRLLLIDVVNRALSQTEDEAPLHIK